MISFHWYGKRVLVGERGAVATAARALHRQRKAARDDAVVRIQVCVLNFLNWRLVQHRACATIQRAVRVSRPVHGL